MAVTVQVGQTAAIKLVFKDSGGNVVIPPTSGGALTRNTTVVNGNVGKIHLDSDGQTVHYEALVIGTDTLTYTVAAPSGSISCTETVTIVATTASSVSFDETSFVTPDPTPPASTSYV